MSKILEEYKVKIDPEIYQQYTETNRNLTKVKLTLEEQYQYVNEMNLRIKENDALYKQTKVQLQTLIATETQYTESELDVQLKFISQEQVRIRQENDKLIADYKKILKAIEENEMKKVTLKQELDRIKIPLK